MKSKLLLAIGGMALWVGVAACTALFGESITPVDLAVPLEPDQAVPHDMATAPADLLHSWSYQKLQVGALNGVWGAPSDGGTVWYAVGAGGSIFVSTDDGDHWQPRPPAVTSELRGVYGRGADDVYVGGDALATPTSGGGLVPTLLHGDRNGFVRDDAPIDGVYATRVWSAGPGEKVWAVGACGILTTSGTDGSGGTVTWIAEAGGICDIPVGLWGTASHDVWSGTGGINANYTNVIHSNGVAFAGAGADFPFTMKRYALFGFGTPGVTSDLWVAGESTTVEHWRPGSGWAIDTNADGGVPLRGLWGTSSTDLWAVGGENTVMHRTASGWVTETLPGPDKVSLLDVFGLPGGRVIAVGEFGYVFVRK